MPNTPFVQNLRAAQFDNGETVLDAFCYAAPSVTYSTGSVSISTDPFTSKTNKYAESKLVEFVSTTAFHVKWSAAGTAAVAATDVLVPANMRRIMVVAPGLEFVRVIADTGSSTIYVTELY